MKNCNPCNKHEYDPCNKECVVKLLVDECTGNPINYITLASAVLMECNSATTVKEVIDNLANHINDLENIVSRLDLETFLTQIQEKYDNLELNLKNEIENDIINHIHEHDLNGLTELITNLFNSWKIDIEELIERLAQGSGGGTGTVTGVLMNLTVYGPDSLGYVDLGTGWAKTSDLNGYATETYVSDNYQPKGNYLTEHQDLSEYAKTADIAEAYQPKGEYLTEHQDLSEYAKLTDIPDVKSELTKESLVSNKIATIPATGMLSAAFKDDLSGYSSYNIKIEPHDINGDGSWDIADINAVINVMLGKESPSVYNGRTDLNGDGSTDVGDLNSVINIVLGIDNAPLNVFHAINNNGQRVLLTEGSIYYNLDHNSVFLVYDVNSDGEFKIKSLDDNDAGKSIIGYSEMQAVVPTEVYDNPGETETIYGKPLYAISLAKNLIEDGVTEMTVSMFGVNCTFENVAIDSSDNITANGIGKAILTSEDKYEFISDEEAATTENVKTLPLTLTQSSNSNTVAVTIGEPITD